MAAGRPAVGRRPFSLPTGGNPTTHEFTIELGGKTLDERTSNFELAGNRSGARRLGMAKRSIEGRNDPGPPTRVLRRPVFSAKKKQPLDEAGGHPREHIVMNVVFARKSAQRTRRRRAQLSLENSDNPD